MTQHPHWTTDALILHVTLQDPKWHSEFRDALECTDEQAERICDRLAREGKIICPDGRWQRCTPALRSGER